MSYEKYVLYKERLAPERGSVMSDRVGQRLGNYHLLRLLGRGGFAQVYLGEHLRLGTQAAIKLLFTHLLDDDVEQFLAEARALARLEHPHIIRILDFDVEQDVPFLVMSYAPNGTLRQRYPKGTRLSPDVILLYLKQAAGALQCAHNARLIHRDIKPENMLLGQRDDILLSDFGIAVVAHSSRSQSTQEIIGTVSYKHTSTVNTVARSPDGTRIASASGNFFLGGEHSVQVWDAATGVHILTYKGHTTPVNTVAWSPDSKRIASASAGVDKNVQIWDAMSGSTVYTYHGHTLGVNDVARSPDGQYIASASNDGTVRVWQAS
jgi:serine/threonine protein kinase